MKKYVLRYLPLLILIMLFGAVRLYALASSGVRSPSYSSTQSTTISMQEKALYALAFANTQAGWAVGGAFLNKYNVGNHLSASTPTGGLIWRYTAGNWSLFATTAQPLRSVSMVAQNDGWAVGDAGTLLHYTGQGWANVSSPTVVDLSAVRALSANDVWVVGFGGLILHYDGTGWTSVHSPTRANLRSIAFSSPGDGWIVGDQGTLLHYQNQVWQQITSPTSATLYSVTMLSADESWAVGANETILHERAGTWYTVGTPGAFGIINPNGTDPATLNTFHTISMASVNSGWIASTDGLLSYTNEVWSANQDGILNTSSSYTQGGAILYGVQMLSAQAGWAVGEYNQDVLFFHYQNGTWQDYY